MSTILMYIIPKDFTMKTRGPKITEAGIEKAVCDLLMLDGWRCFKMEQNFSERKEKRIGEKGMPDRLFIRYGAGVDAEVLWIETKAPGKIPDVHQILWHEAERGRGSVVLVVDSIEWFRGWYFWSGLCRNKSLLGKAAINLC